MFNRSYKKIVENDLIYLRKFSLSDDEFMLELMNQPGWLSQIGDRNIGSRLDAREYLKNGPIRTYKTHNFGLYLVVRQQDDLPLGTCGLLQRSYLEAPDIGFAISENYYRSGIGYQSASLVLRHANENLSIKKLFATTKPNNHASQQLLLKLGFNNIGQCDVEIDNQEPETLNLFKLVF